MSLGTVFSIPVKRELRKSIRGTLLLCGFTIAKATLAQTAPTPLSVAVDFGPRQQFNGMGASIVPDLSSYWFFKQVTSNEEAAMAKMIWGKAKFNSARVWFDPARYAPTKGQRNIQYYLDAYINTGKIHAAQAAGCKDLLLAPQQIPSYMSDGHGNLAVASIPDYTDLLADFIYEFKSNSGILINYAGVVNEPDAASVTIPPTEWPEVIKSFRQSLDDRALQAVKILGPESANCGSWTYSVAAALKADAAAWKAVHGLATHSYNKCASPSMPSLLDGHEYWQTESGAFVDQNEGAGDAVQAAVASSRFLNDMNHGVNRWMYFGSASPSNINQNSGHIMSWTAAPFNLVVHQKYSYLKQLSDAFDVGAVFRHSTSSLDGEMTFQSGLKPRVNAAVAQNPDGSWSIGLSNFTSDAFASSTNSWYKTQGGKPAQAFSVSVSVPELANRDSLKFNVYRSNSFLNEVYMGTVTMQKGKVTIPQLGSLDLITLRSVQHSIVSND